MSLWKKNDNYTKTKEHGKSKTETTITDSIIVPPYLLKTAVNTIYVHDLAHRPKLELFNLKKKILSKTLTFPCKSSLLPKSLSSMSFLPKS